MQYCQLGNSDLNVSRVAFGVMTFGDWSYESFRAGVDQASADQMVGVALDAGINLFDTAEAYGSGQSEVMLGAALKRAGRDRAIVATKALSHQPESGGERPRDRYRHLIEHVEASLRRLGTDWIDLYQVQPPDFETAMPDETLEALSDVVARGLVRHVGWSNNPAWYAARNEGIQRLRGFTPFISGQMYYSLIGRDAERDILPYCRAAGLGTLIWSPLAGGFLTGKTAGRSAGGVGRRASFSPNESEAGRSAITLMKQIAAASGTTLTQVALAWLLAKPGVSSVLVGASGPEQLAHSAQAAEVRLDEAQMAVLDTIAPPVPTYPLPDWWTVRPHAHAPFAGPPSLWARSTTPID